MPIVRFPVVLMGPGNVGKAVLNRIVSSQTLFQSQLKIRFDVKAVSIAQHLQGEGFAVWGRWSESVECAERGASECVACARSLARSRAAGL